MIYGVLHVTLSPRLLYVKHNCDNPQSGENEHNENVDVIVVLESTNVCIEEDTALIPNNVDNVNDQNIEESVTEVIIEDVLNRDIENPSKIIDIIKR